MKNNDIKMYVIKNPLSQFSTERKVLKWGIDFKSFDDAHLIITKKAMILLTNKCNSK